MKITDLRIEIAEKEGKKKQLNIADISEVLKVLREVIIENGGEDLYKIIRKL